MCGNFIRAFAGGLGVGVGASIPGHPALRRHYRDIAHLSAAFAFAADVAMLVLGASIKRREKLSGRLADILGQLYLASAVLKRFEDDGRPDADLPLVHWGLQDALARAEEAVAALALAGPAAVIEARRRAGRADADASPSPAHAAGDAGGIITPAETGLLERFEHLRRACIMVDDFAPDAGTRPAETSAAMSAANVVAPASRQVSDRIEETHAE